MLHHADRRTRQRRLSQFGRYLLLCALALIVLAPIYLNVVAALLPPKFRLAYPPPLYPKEPTFSAFTLAIRRGSLLRYFVNSTVVSISITVGQVVTTCLAAYAISFMNVPMRRTLFWVVVGAGVIPAEAIIVGNYRTVVRLQWIDTYPALIVPFLASSLGVLLLSRAFRTVPNDLIAADPGIITVFTPSAYARRTPWSASRRSR